MKHQTDEEIMLQVSDGNLEKLSILFDRYHIRIFNFFIKMCGNKMISEDLTQEVFIKILKYRTSYKEGSFKSWIYTIARNLFLSHYQKNKKDHLHITDDFTQLKSSSAVNNNEEIAHLQQVLQKLNPQEKELIVMNRFQEIKYEQMATILNSTTNAVKVKTHRAIKKLKELYFQMQ